MCRPNHQSSCCWLAESCLCQLQVTGPMKHSADAVSYGYYAATIKLYAVRLASGWPVQSLLCQSQAKLGRAVFGTGSPLTHRHYRWLSNLLPLTCHHVYAEAA